MASMQRETSIRPLAALRAFFADEERPSNNSGQKGGDKQPGGQKGKGQGQGQGQQGPQQGPGRGLFGFVMLALLLVLLITVFSYSSTGERLTWKEFEQHYKADEINEPIVLHSTSITARLDQPEVEGEPTPVTVPINEVSREQIAERLHNLTDGNYISKPQSPWIQFLLVFGPFLLILLLLFFFISRGLRSMSGGGGMLGNFGKSKHRQLTKEMTGITFKDVAGVDEAKDEVTEIIEFLKAPKRFTRLGGRIPRGVLLVGEPGCGKTLLAKAIAGEADVPFFSISGSDFVEMFVGVGASRVRDLFKQAKESAPCIIFLDEIDAVGRRRGGGFSSGGHDEREQTLNAILVEMDGLNSSATGDRHRRDQPRRRARPGAGASGPIRSADPGAAARCQGALEILKVHSGKVKLGPAVDLEKIARGTPMFSGADLAAIINEAAISATMQNKDFIEHEDLEEARDKVKFGRARKSRKREEEENRLVAYHESGHAVLQAVLENTDPLHKVTIIPRGGSGGATFSLPEKDRMGYSLRWLLATMRVLCGGRIAEQKALDDVSSGAAMDITQVTQLARTMVTEWGMSDRLGFVRYAGTDTQQNFLSEREISDETAQLIDEEVRRIVDEAYTDAKRILDSKWDAVERVAESLIKHETLDADEVHKLIRGEPLGKPSVSDLLAREAPEAARPSEAKPSEGEEPDLPPGALPSPA